MPRPMKKRKVAETLPKEIPYKTRNREDRIPAKRKLSEDKENDEDVLPDSQKTIDYDLDESTIQFPISGTDAKDLNESDDVQVIVQEEVVICLSSDDDEDNKTPEKVEIKPSIKKDVPMTTPFKVVKSSTTKKNKSPKTPAKGRTTGKNSKKQSSSKKKLNSVDLTGPREKAITSYFERISKSQFNQGLVTKTPIAGTPLAKHELLEYTPNPASRPPSIASMQSSAKSVSTIRRRRQPLNLPHIVRVRPNANQKRVSKFLDFPEEEDRIGYLDTVKESRMPLDSLFSASLMKDSSIVQSDGFIELQKRLEEDFPNEDNLINDDSLGKAKMDDERSNDSGISSDHRYVEVKRLSPLILDKPVKIVGESARKKNIDVPSYKIVEGTTFAVDAFRFGLIRGVTHYLLSHFHADHYLGLRKKFQMPLIMSPITSRLVKSLIGVDESYYIIIDVNESVVINGTKVTALDANHCPGAVLFLFQLPNGRNHLHTGDFRANMYMEEYFQLWNMDIDLLYLDTTYLASKYDFKNQEESISAAIKIVASHLHQKIGHKTLIVFGAYVIGKEKIWTKVARRFNFKVFTTGNRLKALNAVNDPENLSLLVDDPLDADIHILTLGQVQLKYLREYFAHYSEHYDNLLAIRPSGWEINNKKPIVIGPISIHGVEYSEHSSLNEMKRFVGFLRPNRVQSTVPYSHRGVYKTPQVPVEWYKGPIEPVRPEKKMRQTLLTSVMKSVPKTVKKTEKTVELKCSKKISFNVNPEDCEPTTSKQDGLKKSWESAEKQHISSATPIKEPDENVFETSFVQSEAEDDDDDDWMS